MYEQRLPAVETDRGQRVARLSVLTRRTVQMPRRHDAEGSTSAAPSTLLDSRAVNVASPAECSVGSRIPGAIASDDRSD